jgi:hypothetical protein
MLTELAHKCSGHVCAWSILAQRRSAARVRSDLFGAIRTLSRHFPRGTADSIPLCGPESSRNGRRGTTTDRGLWLHSAPPCDSTARRSCELPEIHLTGACKDNVCHAPRDGLGGEGTQTSAWCCSMRSTISLANAATGTVCTRQLLIAKQVRTHRADEFIRLVASGQAQDAKSWQSWRDRIARGQLLRVAPLGRLGAESDFN